MRKGQVTIEFLMLLLVMLLYVQAIVQPNMEITSSAATDVANAGRGVAELSKFYNAVVDVGYSTGDAKSTVTLFMPPYSVLQCNSSQASVSIALSQALFSQKVNNANCADETDRQLCTKIIPFPSDLTVACNLKWPNSSASESTSAPPAKEITIIKSGSTVTVS